MINTNVIKSQSSEKIFNTCKWTTTEKVQTGFHVNHGTKWTVSSSDNPHTNLQKSASEKIFRNRSKAI